MHSVSFFDFLGSIDRRYPCSYSRFHRWFHPLSNIHVLLTDTIEFYPRYYPRTLNCGYLSLFIIVVVACCNLFLVWCAQSKQYIHTSTYTNRRPPQYQQFDTPSVSKRTQRAMKLALSYIQ